MPLPGGGTCDPRNNRNCTLGTEKRLYQITSEIGGYDCVETGGDIAHQDVYSNSGRPAFNYFALDIVGPFLSRFTSTPGGKVPIIAAASGFVDTVGSDPVNNGNHMVIRHWSNGTNPGYSAIPGYSTLYLHMTDLPARSNGVLWKVGDAINQGDLIGYMGNTGHTSATPSCPTCGVHLHFAIRYGDASPPVAGTTVAGAKNIPQLTNATMDGFILKSYQTDCGSGGPNLRYYQSGNRQYQ
jgi:hypothetical protein